MAQGGSLCYSQRKKETDSGNSIENGLEDMALMIIEKENELEKNLNVKLAKKNIFIPAH